MLRILRGILRKISEYDARCRLAGYTDAGEAWGLLHSIEQELVQAIFTHVHKKKGKPR